VAVNPEIMKEGDLLVQKNFGIAEAELIELQAIIKPEPTIG